MFWTDLGNRRIERANMDGTNRTVLSDINLFRIQGLTIDYTLRTLYWADSYLDYIGSMTYDGKNRREIIGRPEIAQPFAITIFNNHLYFTDWIWRAVVKVDKFTGKKSITLLKDLIKPMDIKVYHKTRQPTAVNPCAEDNCGCQHICLLSARQTCTCKCEIGFHLDVNNKSCVKIEEFLLYPQMNAIYGVPLMSNISSSPMLPIQDVVFPLALDFDYAERFVYFKENEQNHAKRVSLKGHAPQLVTELFNVFSMAVDWLGRNLYFGSASLNYEILVSKLDGSFKKRLFIDLDRPPYQIALHPRCG